MGSWTTSTLVSATRKSLSIGSDTKGFAVITVEYEEYGPTVMRLTVDEAEALRDQFFHVCAFLRAREKREG